MTFFTLNILCHILKNLPIKPNFHKNVYRKYYNNIFYFFYLLGMEDGPLMLMGQSSRVQYGSTIKVIMLCPLFTMVSVTPC